MIHNHFSATLSELDKAMVRSVPPGGNWKNIPDSIPSKRLEQIRVSFAAGNGSRSTYYGRLRPDMPSYTISTYFNRPGNGCFIHYDQNRLISQREAARLQTFPDSFVFHGSRTDVNKQIGNAVPPLLAFQIALHLGKAGHFVDLFAGAGGMSLGFSWASWKPIVSNELVKTYAKTYCSNIHGKSIVGDIADKSIFNELVDEVNRYRRTESVRRLFLLGGPPCQGFSTAGNSRSMADERNHLYKNYARILAELKPEAFIFENVPGIINMEDGRVFKQIQKTLHAAGYEILTWVLNTEEYAIPQRRKRVFIVGFSNMPLPKTPPPELTSIENGNSLFGVKKKPISVYDALSDLPPILAGQDGSEFSYVSKPKNTFQRLMRSNINAEIFISDYK